MIRIETHMRARRGCRTRLGVGLLSSVLILAGCADVAGDDGAVRVGLLGNLTGISAASFGVPFKQGFDLAIQDTEEQIQEAGVDLEIVTEDTNSEVPTAVTSYNRLAQQDVSLVISDSQSPIGQAVAPLANNDEIAFLSGAGSELENGQGYAFRFTDLATASTKMGEYLANEGYTRVGIVEASDNPAYAGLGAITGEALPSGYVASEKVSSTDSDYAAILTNLGQADVDAIVLAVPPDQAGNLILQASQSSAFDDVQLAGNFAVSEETYRIAGEATDGFVFPATWVPGADRSAEFVEAFEEEYGESPGSYLAATGYEIGLVTAAAVIAAAESADEVSGASIRDSLVDASNSDMFADQSIVDITLNEDGSALVEGAICRFDDAGEIVEVSASGSGS